MAKDGYDCSEIPCVEVLADSLKEAKLRVLQGTSQYGEMTNDGLKEYLSDSDLDLSEIEAFRFPEIDLKEFDSIIEPNEKDDEIPEVVDPVTKIGDLWLLGEHRVLCGDCTDKKDIKKIMDNETAKFCFTSPPYSDMRDYSGNLNLDPSHLAKFLHAPCELFAVNLGLQRKDHELVQYWDDYIAEAKSAGHKFLSWNVWDKGECGSVGNQTAIFGIRHEWIFIFGMPTKLNRTVKTKSPKGTTGAGTIRHKDGTMSRKKPALVGLYKQLETITECAPAKGLSSIKHPAMFPSRLPEIYIDACSKKNDVIFEPFCGSGTTLIACEKTNRKCYGMEIDPHYCDVIVKRWEEYTGKKATLERNDKKKTG